MPVWGWAVAVVIVGLAATIAYTLAFKQATKAARDRSREILKEAEAARQLAEREIEARRREAVLEAKDAAIRQKEEVDAEIRQIRVDLARVEERLAQKEDLLGQRSQALNEREQETTRAEARLQARRQELEQEWSKHQDRLERIAGLTTEEARDEVISAARIQAEQDVSRMLRRMEEEAEAEATRKARNVLSLAINRCAVDQATETTVSVVPLPSDEMKGRIIGREGRNIRSIETLTGVDLIIDDTPEAVVLSSFDPVRREVARLALTDLVEDGRIHPGRIEEAIGKAHAQVEAEMQEAAEHALLDVGVAGLPPELTKYLGRLKFRTSYGQNCLNHSVEVAYLAGFMASELGLSPVVAKRAGLLHDLGKAVDLEMEGPHALVGLELLRKSGESEPVMHAVAAHHSDIQPETVEAVLVQAADAVSAARPGARRESLEQYIKRLERLERIAESFSGVEKTYAIQAGREIRVMVRPEEVDDDRAAVLARETAKRIEQEMEYPGQIKVTVIRETRAVDYAK